MNASRKLAECGLVRRHVGAFVDGELDPTTMVEFERHFETCALCEEHLAFERQFQLDLRETQKDTKAPEGLRARLLERLDAEPQPRAGEPMVRILPMSWKHAVPLAAAATVLFAVGGAGTLSTAGETQQASTAGTGGIFRDVVRVHSSDLPSDVDRPQPQQLARYFRGKVRFPVRAARFAHSDIELVGARLSNVRERQAAALYYDVRGHRVTVVVFEHRSGAIPRGARRAHLGGRDVFYRDVGGYTVPVRRAGRITYAFTGDLGREELLGLAATAQVQP